MFKPKKPQEYTCSICDFNTSNKKDMNKHIKTQKHKMGFLNQFLNQNSAEFYTCKTCDYNAANKEDIITHINTENHFGVFLNQKTPYHKITISSDNSCNECVCGKKYIGRSGLWHHKKICIFFKKSEPCDPCDTSETSEPSQSTEPIKNSNKFDQTMLDAFMTLMKQNQEFTELFMEQNKQTQEFQKQLLDVSKEGKIINNNNNNNNNTTTTNNSFNLHVYLNETCKDAVNMLDFVNSLHLELSDLEETGKLGYSGGMSRIFINGLKDMEVHKRPIHCSDLKREILYIKEDNVWEKDNENRDGIKNALRMIEQKNIQQIPLWIKAHPNCVISSNRENTPYLKMVMQSTGGQNPDETANMAKIITSIAKAVVINK